MTKAQAGRLGQAALRRKLGADYADHMRNIGKRGAKAFWSKYRLIPIGTSQFAIVCRVTGKFINYIE